MKNAVLSLVVLVLAGCTQTATAPPAAALPAAPSMTSMPLSAIGAEGVGKMLDNAKGKVIVLNFWATWCPPCVAEMPELAKFYSATSRGEIEFISLCANDPGELRTTVAAFQKEKKLPFPVYVLNDPGGVEALAKATRAGLSGGLPATLIYARDGALKHLWERETTSAELMEAIKPLL